MAYKIAIKIEEIGPNKLYEKYAVLRKGHNKILILQCADSSSYTYDSLYIGRIFRVYRTYQKQNDIYKMSGAFIVETYNVRNALI